MSRPTLATIDCESTIDYNDSNDFHDYDLIDFQKSTIDYRLWESGQPGGPFSVEKCGKIAKFPSKNVNLE